MSFTLHHLFTSKESCTARHADLYFPSLLWMGTKDRGTVFSGEKPTRVFFRTRGEVGRKEGRKTGKKGWRDQRKVF